MKIVVTGGSGNFGQYVVAELSDAGHDVLSIDRHPHPRGYRPSWSIDLLQSGDVYQALAKAETVVHLAGHTAPGLTSDSNTFNDNVRISYNVLNAASNLDIRRVVVASSIAAYGLLYSLEERRPRYLPIDEDHPCRPTDPYGLSKVVGETICESFAESARMSIVSLRFPGINYDVSYERIARLMKLPGDRRRGFWSYVDVRDAARAIRLGIEAQLNGHRIFNIAAPTSNMREPTRDLIARYYPNIAQTTHDDGGNWSGVSSKRAEQELGFAAEHTWERYLNN